MKRILRRTPLSLSTYALVMLFACASADLLTRSAPDIRGVITRSDVSAERKQIRVEENPNDSASSQKAMIQLKEQTKIFKRTGSSLEQINTAELTVGKTVSAWFEGPVAESYPIQATASAVVLEAE